MPELKTVGLFLFELMASRIQALKSAGFKTHEEHHNLYTIYTLQMLNLASGHRPVRQPYDDISRFDLIGKCFDQYSLFALGRDSFAGKGRYSSLTTKPVFGQQV